MNLPNKLTVARIIATPLFMAIMMINFPHHYAVALAVFVVAAITDYLDGNIARKRKIVTSFGKFLDPLADKMLTTAAFIGFLAKGFGFGIEWILFIVLFREFMIASLRLVAVSSDKKKVIAANIWGKVKTVSQMIAIIFGLVVMYFNDSIKKYLPSVPATVPQILETVFSVTVWISAVFAVISGIIYLKDSYDFIDSTK